MNDFKYYVRGSSVIVERGGDIISELSHLNGIRISIDETEPSGEYISVDGDSIGLYHHFTNIIEIGGVSTSGLTPIQVVDKLNDLIFSVTSTSGNGGGGGGSQANVNNYIEVLEYSLKTFTGYNSITIAAVSGGAIAIQDADNNIVLLPLASPNGDITEVTFGGVSSGVSTITVDASMGKALIIQTK